jgi:hypothetical protein
LQSQCRLAVQSSRRSNFKRKKPKITNSCAQNHNEVIGKRGVMNFRVNPLMRTTTTTTKSSGCSVCGVLTLGGLLGLVVVCGVCACVCARWRWRRRCCCQPARRDLKSGGWSGHEAPGAGLGGAGDWLPLGPRRTANSCRWGTADVLGTSWASPRGNDCLTGPHQPLSCSGLASVFKVF